MEEYENLKSVLALNVSKLRKKNSLTQEELAEKIGISDQTIGKIERKECWAYDTTIQKIAEYFKIPPYALLKPGSDNLNQQEVVRFLNDFFKFLSDNKHIFTEI